MPEDTKTEIALIKQSQKIMQKNEENSRKETRENFQNVFNAIKDIPKEMEKMFATKLELEQVQNKVENTTIKADKHDKWLLGVAGVILLAVLYAIIGSIGI